MKTLKLSLILTFLFGAMLFTSCEKEVLESEQQNQDAIQIGNFEKTITIRDEKGENAVVLKVSANEASDLDFYTERSFSLIPIYTEELSQPTTDGFVGNDGANASKTDVGIFIIEQKLSNGVLGFNLKEKNSRRTLAPCGYIFGNSKAHKIVLNNTGATKQFYRYHSPWGINTWNYVGSYYIGCSKINLCNPYGGIAIKALSSGIDVVCYTNC